MKKIFAALYLLTSIAYATPPEPPKGDFKPMPMPGGYRSINIDTGANANARLETNNTIDNNAMGGAGGVGVGGTGGAGGMGGSGVGGNASVRLGGGSGIGNSNFRYPVQPPIIMQPMSTWPCATSFGMSGAGGGNASGGFAFPWSYDECIAIYDSKHFMETLGMPKSACERFVRSSDDNEEAAKAAGETCQQVKQMAYPMPANYMPAQTPTLDRVAPDYITRPELNQKLSNYDRLHNQKWGLQPRFWKRLNA